MHRLDFPCYDGSRLAGKETTNLLLLSHSAGSTIRRLVSRPRQEDAAKTNVVLRSCGLTAHYGLQEAWNRLVAATR
jgi:hypothetical protein